MLKEGTKLASIRLNDGSQVHSGRQFFRPEHPGGCCEDITVYLENGQMAEVAWAKLTMRYTEDIYVNLALVQEFTLGETDDS